jgi:hypothetical protein
MLVRQFFANFLPDIQRGELFNHFSAEQKRNQQGGNRRPSRAKRDVLNTFKPLKKYDSLARP